MDWSLGKVQMIVMKIGLPFPVYRTDMMSYQVEHCHVLSIFTTPDFQRRFLPFIDRLRVDQNDVGLSRVVHKSPPFPLMMISNFIPRQAFPYYGAIQRSYYLGHHRAGLNKMRAMLSDIDYVVECRDYRAPVSSVNPAFEEALGETRRLIVYTKRDLGNGLNPSVRRQVRSTDAKGRMEH